MLVNKCLQHSVFIIIIIGLILLPQKSCNFSDEQKIKGNLKIINVNNLDNKELILSDYFSSIKFLPLETKENILLPRIYKMKKVKDRYYFITNTPFSEFYIFNEDGRFIKSMNKYGKGPGEYTYLEDFYVTPDGSR